MDETDIIKVEDVKEEKPEEIVEEEVKETIEETAEESGSKNNYPTQLVLTIRTIVGAYVMYLAYQIITSGSEITPFMWAAVVLFIVAGAGLVIMSVKRFITGEYEGGKKDV